MVNEEDVPKKAGEDNVRSKTFISIPVNLKDSHSLELIHGFKATFGERLAEVAKVSCNRAVMKVFADEPHDVRCSW